MPKINTEMQQQPICIAATKMRFSLLCPALVYPSVCSDDIAVIIKMACSAVQCYLIARDLCSCLEDTQAMLCQPNKEEMHRLHLALSKQRTAPDASRSLIVEDDSLLARSRSLRPEEGAFPF